MATSKKKTTVSANMQRVEKVLEEIPEERQAMAQSLYDELSFMQATMDQLKQQVKEHGAVDYFKQGAQEFWRESPALTAYNKSVQRYNQTFKQLLDMLPDPEDKPQSDELMDFIKE